MILTQIRHVFVFVTSLWLASLLSSRVILFSEEYAKASKYYEDDVFTLHSICNNNHIKANLGKNAHICDQAAINVKIAPWQTALHGVVKNTYLCGNEECIQLLLEATSSMNSLIFSIVVMCISPWVFIWLFNYFFRKVDHHRARRKVQQLSTQISVLPTNGAYIYDEQGRNYKHD